MNKITPEQDFIGRIPLFDDNVDMEVLRVSHRIALNDCRAKFNSHISAAFYQRAIYSNDQLRGLSSREQKKRRWLSLAKEILDYHYDAPSAAEKISELGDQLAYITFLARSYHIKLTEILAVGGNNSADLADFMGENPTVQDFAKNQISLTENYQKCLSLALEIDVLLKDTKKDSPEILELRNKLTYEFWAYICAILRCEPSLNLGTLAAKNLVKLHIRNLGHNFLAEIAEQRLDQKHIKIARMQHKNNTLDLIMATNVNKRGTEFLEIWRKPAILNKR